MKSREKVSIDLKANPELLNELIVLNQVGDFNFHSLQVEQTTLYQKLQTVTDLDASGITRAKYSREKSASTVLNDLGSAMFLLAQLAAMSNSIFSIDLSHNDLGVNGPGIYAQLEKSGSLVYLNMKDNKFSESTKSYIRNCNTKHNKQVTLQNDSLSEGLKCILMHEYLPKDIINSVLLGHYIHTIDVEL